jgi:hypothetical protein
VAFAGGGRASNLPQASAHAEADAGLAALLAAAAAAAIQHHPALADHAVTKLGFVEKLVRVVAARAPAPATPQEEDAGTPPPAPVDDVSASALRLLHALAAAPAAGEALARATPPPAPVLAGALRWGGPAGALVTETLKRALDPGNRSRDLLVGACLGARLPQALLRRLDWRRAGGGAGGAADEVRARAACRPQQSSRSTCHRQPCQPIQFEPRVVCQFADSLSRACGVCWAQDREGAVQRVLCVDVLNRLTLEGAYAPQVRALLDASDVWAAHRGQRHDLFLPAGGGGGAAGVAGLLRGGDDASRFALLLRAGPPPASESPVREPQSAAARGEEAAAAESAADEMAGAVEGAEGAAPPPPTTTTTPAAPMAAVAAPAEQVAEAAASPPRQLAGDPLQPAQPTAVSTPAAPEEAPSQPPQPPPLQRPPSSPPAAVAPAPQAEERAAPVARAAAAPPRSPTHTPLASPKRGKAFVDPLSALDPADDGGD